MILTTVDEAAQYKGISIYLDAAIVKGVFSIDCADGTTMTVKCSEPALLPTEKATLEAHERFIDIQIPLKGTEGMGWSPIRWPRTPAAWLLFPGRRPRAEYRPG